MIVIDASVAFKWLKSENEPYHKEAIKILKDHLGKKTEILAPDLIFIEIANALVTKSSTTHATIKKDLSFLFKANLKIFEPSQKDIFKSSELAKKHKTTVYDMLYAVIAKKNKTILVTADDSFVQKTGFKFVKHIKDL